jgi:hypothetical protein
MVPPTSAPSVVSFMEMSFMVPPTCALSTIFPMELSSVVLL